MSTSEFGVLAPLMEDEKVVRITVFRPDNINIWHDDIGMDKPDIKFADEEAVHKLAEQLARSAGMPFDYQHPITDVRLGDGTRAMLVHRHISSGGTLIHIEKAFDDQITLQKLVSFPALSQEAADFLIACVKGHAKIAVVGGYHGRIKTALNAIARHISTWAPIVIIQPYNTIHLPDHENVIKLESQRATFMNVDHLDNRALLEAGLRMRPHRLIVAELDGTEMNGVLNAMQSGLDVMFAMRASNPVDALARLETMAIANDLSRPVLAVREQIAASLDLIVHIDLMNDGFQRVITISAVDGMQADTVELLTIFDRENGIAGGDFLPTGTIPQRLLQRLESNGVTVDTGIFTA